MSAGDVVFWIGGIAMALFFVALFGLLAVCLVSEFTKPQPKDTGSRSSQAWWAVGAALFILFYLFA